MQDFDGEGKPPGRGFETDEGVLEGDEGEEEEGGEGEEEEQEEKGEIGEVGNISSKHLTSSPSSLQGPRPPRPAKPPKPPKTAKELFADTLSRALNKGREKGEAKLVVDKEEVEEKWKGEKVTSKFEKLYEKKTKEYEKKKKEYEEKLKKEAEVKEEEEEGEVVEEEEEVVEEEEEEEEEDLGPATTTEISQGLMKLHGVGQKVADCVALFGMECHDTVPCDTHVFQMAARWDDGLAAMQRKAKEEKKTVSMTAKVHEQVGKVFRDSFPGGYAGWAQSVLFCLELPSFKEAIAKIQDTEKVKKEEEEAMEGTVTKKEGGCK